MREGATTGCPPNFITSHNPLQSAWEEGGIRKREREREREKEREREREKRMGRRRGKGSSEGNYDVA